MLLKLESQDWIFVMHFDRIGELSVHVWLGILGNSHDSSRIPLKAGSGLITRTVCCEPTRIQIYAIAITPAGTHWWNCYSCPNLTCLATHSIGTCRLLGHAPTNSSQECAISCPKW